MRCRCAGGLPRDGDRDYALVLILLGSRASAPPLKPCSSLISPFVSRLFDFFLARCCHDDFLSFRTASSVSLIPWSTLCAPIGVS